MKLLHLSDLHLGKRVNEFNMLDDQAYILRQILAVADEEQPEAVLIAGDVYDKSVPSAEATQPPAQPPTEPPATEPPGPTVSTVTMVAVGAATPRKLV